MGGAANEPVDDALQDVLVREGHVRKTDLIGQQGHPIAFVRDQQGAGKEGFQRPIMTDQAQPILLLYLPPHGVGAVNARRRPVHLGQALRRDQALALVQSCVQLRDQVMGHILGCGDKKARR